MIIIRLKVNNYILEFQGLEMSVRTIPDTSDILDGSESLFDNSPNSFFEEAASFCELLPAEVVDEVPEPTSFVNVSGMAHITPLKMPLSDASPPSSSSTNIAPSSENLPETKTKLKCDQCLFTTIYNA